MTALLRGERAGWDYAIEWVRRDSPILVLAPHGGAIEEGTDTLARAIAGEDFSFYTFRSLRAEKARLHHVTSHRFDEPHCLELLRASALALSIHGYDAVLPVVFPGGRNMALRKLMMDALIRGGFPVRFHRRLMGLEPRNPVNLPAWAGVQLELSLGLRRELLNGQEGGFTERGRQFVEAVRGVLGRLASSPVFAKG